MNRTIKNAAKIMPVLMMLILLAACGKGDEHQSDDTVNLLQSGNFYYEGTFYDGSDLDGYTIKLAVQGSEFVIAFNDQQGAEIGRSINVGGKGYYVDAASKQYSRDNYYDGVTFAYSDLTFIESGKAKITALAGIIDETLSFEKYEVTYGSNIGKMQFFFKEDKLYAIQEDFIDATGEEISEVVIIKKISSVTPKDWFGIPEDYTEVNE
jgi:hypothetical protein